MNTNYKHSFFNDCLNHSLTQGKSFLDSVAFLAENADAKIIMPKIVLDITTEDLCSAHQHVQSALDCGYEVDSYDSYIVEHYLLRVGSEYANNNGL